MIRKGSTDIAHIAPARMLTRDVRPEQTTNGVSLEKLYRTLSKFAEYFNP